MGVCFPGLKKQTHPRILSVKIRKHTCCGEKPAEGACSEREHVFHPGHPASHKLQVGEEEEFQVPVSKQRVWTRSLKRATL